MISRLLLLCLLLECMACAIEPQPIAYGSDNCAFCRMTIVDIKHAAEVINDKGKPFKFDAIECMVDYVNKNPETTYSMYLVTDYLGEGTLKDANKCTYLISPNIPSPMGRFLSAFEDPKQAQNYLEEHGGQLYSWPELIEFFKQ